MAAATVGITDEFVVDNPVTGVGVPIRLPEAANKGVDPLARPMP